MRLLCRSKGNALVSSSRDRITSIIMLIVVPVVLATAWFPQNSSSSQHRPSIE